MEVDAQAIINQLVAQRNAALDSNAQLAAMCEMLKREVEALKAPSPAAE